MCGGSESPIEALAVSTARMRQPCECACLLRCCLSGLDG
eukprot:CAMPEP_0115160440 /NCGR_PEP_ID=MMETSP0227-20121206/70812_1 /TAXON_ID=89957 /ORGANISM="Polarella glacialis, Strain CCMP 1383" /LENGTH=38 /DNA_ID= /DNA_START= /DNA_END= /DNA_ORIENTATION=